MKLREAELDRYDLEAGPSLSGDGDTVEANEVFVQWSTTTCRSSSRKPDCRAARLGRRRYLAKAETRSDQSTVMEHREDLHPQIVIVSELVTFVNYPPRPGGVDDQKRRQSQTRCCRGLRCRASPPKQGHHRGLPYRVELFEARVIPKDAAERRIDGLSKDKLRLR